MAIRCKCGAARLTDEDDVFRGQLTNTVHTQSMCMTYNEHIAAVRGGSSSVYAALQGMGGGGGYTMTTVTTGTTAPIQADTAEQREQKSYRAGWNAGARKAEAELASVRKGHARQAEMTSKWIAECCAAQREVESLKAQLSAQQIDWSKANKRMDNASDAFGYALAKSQVASMTEFKPAPIDLARMRHDSAVNADRAASQAHADREPWDAGLDDDEEA